jgi:hypothetical protein
LPHRPLYKISQPDNYPKAPFPIFFLSVKTETSLNFISARLLRSYFMVEGGRVFLTTGGAETGKAYTGFGASPSILASSVAWLSLFSFRAGSLKY